MAEQSLLEQCLIKMTCRCIIAQQGDKLLHVSRINLMIKRFND